MLYENQAKYLTVLCDCVARSVFSGFNVHLEKGDKLQTLFIGTQESSTMMFNGKMILVNNEYLDIKKEMV